MQFLEEFLYRVCVKIDGVINGSIKCDVDCKAWSHGSGGREEVQFISIFMFG